MLRRPLIVLLAVVALLASGVAGYVQSARFADLAKSFLDRNIPTDWGIVGDFEEIRLGVFPPAVRIIKPRVTLAGRNILNLPEGARVAAGSIELRFYPFQILAGSFRVHEAVIQDGDVDVTIDPSRLKPRKKESKESGATPISWKEIVEIRADSLVFENTRVQLRWTEPKVSAGFLAEKLRITQALARGVWGAQLVFVLSDIVGEYPKSWALPRRIDLLSAFAQISTEGASLQRARLEADGLKVGGALKLVGDVFEAESLMVNGDLGIAADLAKTFALLGLKTQASGQAEFNGKIQGNLARLKETVEATGEVKGTDLSLAGWHADHIQVSGNWTPKNQRVITVTEALIEEKAAERVGGEQRGRGGKIKLGAFRIPLVSPEPFAVPVTIEDAHLHWLLGPAIKDVYGLEFRVGGSINASITPGDQTTPWRVRTAVDLTMPSLELNNQRIGKTRPLKRVVKASRLHLVGGLDLDAKALRPSGLKLRVGKQTEFQVGGEVNFKTGYGLLVRGETDLDDVEMLADKPVKGIGGLNLSVHGLPVDTYIDFDLDLKNAVYLGLNLGNLRGRLTWADDASELLFQKIKMTLPQSELVANGKIDTDTDKVDLTFQFRRADVSDLVWLFDSLLRDVWWFPSSMTGPTEGMFLVNGELDLAKLKVEARLAGEDWAYFGERFDAVNIHGGYDQGHYFVEQLAARKYGASLAGRYGIDKAGPSWSFETRNFGLRDLDLVSRLDVPVRGQLSLKSTGRTVDGKILSQTSLDLTGVTVRGDPYPSSHLEAHSEQGVLTVEGSANGGDGQVDLVMGSQADAQNTVRLRARDLDCGPALMVLNPRLVADRQLAGRLSGELVATFKGDRLETATGEINISDALFKKTGAEVALARPVRAKITSGDLALPGIELKTAQHSVVADVGLKKGKLSGTLRGKLDLELAEFSTSTVQSAVGFADVALSVSGDPLAPMLDGRIDVRPSTLQLDVLDGPITSFAGPVMFKKNVVHFGDLEGKFAGGRVQLGGDLEVSATRLPRADLRVTLSENRIAVYPFSFVETSGLVTIKGDRVPYLVGGRVVVNQALSREKVLDRKSGSARRVTKYAPEGQGGRSASRSLLALGLQVEAPGKIMIKNDLFDAELKAKIQIVNTIENPRILGKAETIAGKMFFKNHAFQLESGVIDFDSPTSFNPKFEVTARADVKSTRVNLGVSGEFEKMKITLGSEPPLPENEILSLLAIGLTQDELRRLKTTDQSAIQQSEAASLVLHTLDFNRDIKDRTGLEITVDESVNTQQGTSIFRPQTGLETSAAPKIVIKRNIDEKVDLAVGTTVGVGTTSQREVSAEVHVSPGLSVIGIWNSTEGTTTQEQTTSYGVDLKFQKRFR